jgi:type I restriction enzyme S subunit
LNSHYLFHFLGRRDVRLSIAGRAIGATMPNLNTKILEQTAIIVPPPSLQQSFAEKVEPMDDMVRTLLAANEALAKSRDLLLPKLISGEIDLSKAEAKLEAAQ